MGQSRWPSSVRQRSQPPRSRAALSHAAPGGRLRVRVSADRQTGNSVVERRLQHKNRRLLYMLYLSVHKQYVRHVCMFQQRFILCLGF